MTLSGAETVQERPLLSRESKARLSDCGVVHVQCCHYVAEMAVACDLHLHQCAASCRDSVALRQELWRLDVAGL